MLTAASSESRMMASTLQVLRYFVYFWLCWVFVAVLGLSLVAARGFLTAVASPVVEHGALGHSGFSSCGMWAVVATLGLSGMGSTVVAYGLSCSVACGDLPGPGMEPMFPALAGDSLPLSHRGGPQILVE